MKKISFLELMFSTRGYILLGIALLLSVFAHSLIPAIQYKALITLGIFVVLFPVMVRVSQETMNEQIKKQNKESLKDK